MVLSCANTPHPVTLAVLLGCTGFTLLYLKHSQSGHRSPELTLGRLNYGLADSAARSRVDVRYDALDPALLHGVISSIH